VESTTFPAPRIWRAALWPGERLVREHYRFVGAVLLTLIVANEVYARGPNALHWDWLFASGFLTLVAGLRLALRLPDKIHETLTRLVARQVLTDRENDFRHFEQKLHASGRRAALIGGVIAPVVLLAAWVVAKRSALPAYLLTAVVEAAAAVPVGFFIGRAVSYGLLGRRLSRPRFTITVDPEHLDGASGLRPIGDLYFFQAMLVAVPAVFLAAWWVLIPLVNDDYGDWRNVYAALLVLVLGCEALAFLLPMRSFHSIMKTEKDRLLVDEADEISQQVATVQQQLRGSPTDDDRERLEDRLNRLSQRYKAIDTMRTWPVDVRIRRRFALNNLALFIPVISQAVNAPESWQRFLDSVQKALSGQG